MSINLSKFNEIHGSFKNFSKYEKTYLKSLELEPKTPANGASMSSKVTTGKNFRKFQQFQYVSIALRSYHNSKVGLTTSGQFRELQEVQKALRIFRTIMDIMDFMGTLRTMKKFREISRTSGKSFEHFIKAFLVLLIHIPRS